jgi:hypothetical protein
MKILFLKFIIFRNNTKYTLFGNNKDRQNLKRIYYSKNYGRENKIEKERISRVTDY